MLLIFPPTLNLLKYRYCTTSGLPVAYFTNMDLLKEARYKIIQNDRFS